MPRLIARFRLSPSMAVAMLALTVALGGTGYAATKLPKNSVSTTQLANNAVTGAKVKDGSLFANDFAARQIPRGPKGDTGPQGAAGPQGPAGPAGAKGDLGLTPAAEPWQPLALGTGWNNYEGGYHPASFRKDQLGHIWLRGLVASSVAPITGSIIATLPAGYRPTARLLLVVGMGEPHGSGRVDVTTAGTVLWIAGTSDTTNYTSLASINFSTD